MTAVALIVLLLVVGAVLYVVRGSPKLPPETDVILDSVLNNPLPEIVSGTTGFAMSDGLQIWYESILPEGEPSETVLLIMGSGGSAIGWPPKVIRPFIEAGYRVVRYDHRSTGLSDRVENWDRRNPYSVGDMAGDALAVLDALDVEAAHLVGLSMGGMIAQEIAIQHPQRVASLTLMLTSGYIGDPDLPGLTTHYLLTSFVRGIPLLKYRLMGGEENLIKERIAKTIMFLGYDELDIQETAEIALYDLREHGGVSIAAVFQHQAAVTVSGSRYGGLSKLNIPTLVIHGTADQLIPVEHGQKLVEIISDARGIWLEGVGHVFPLPNMDHIMQEILKHIDVL